MDHHRRTQPWPGHSPTRHPAQRHDTEDNRLRIVKVLNEKFLKRKGRRNREDKMRRYHSQLLATLLVPTKLGMFKKTMLIDGGCW